MQYSIKTLLLSTLIFLIGNNLVSAQIFPVQATGIFTLSDGNELRILQDLPSTQISGIVANAKKEKLADFSGSYTKDTGKVLAKMTFCDGKKEQLTFFFTRNDANTSEIYFGIAPNDRKETGNRKGRTRPSLTFQCAKETANIQKPYLGKGSWTGTWKTELGMIRLVHINDIVTGNVFVVGDFKDTGVIQLIDFDGNEVAGEFTSQTQLDGYFKITRVSENRFEGTYRWGRQSEWISWGGERKDARLPQLTSEGAQHLVNRLLTEY